MQSGRLAIVLDGLDGRIARYKLPRSTIVVDDLPRTASGKVRKQLPTRVVFLEASDDALVRRFSETRRPHPMARR